MISIGLALLCYAAGAENLSVALRVTAIAAGGGHSLALAADGTVWAWGSNSRGQLGDEPPKIRTTPVQVIPPGSPDLAVTMDRDSGLTVGALAVYALTITNTGFTATSGATTVTDNLPPGLSYVSASGAGWTCRATDLVVTCTHPGPFEAGMSSVINLTVEVGASAWPGVTNLAVVSNESDRNISHNTIGDPAVVSPGR